MRATLRSCLLTALLVPALLGQAELVPLGPLVGGAGDLLCDPDDPQVLLAGRGFGGLQRSTDGGATWAPFGTGNDEPLERLSRDPSDPDHLFGLGESTIVRSRDRGQTWEPFQDGTQATLDLVVSPDGAVLLDVTTTKLFRSTDDGESWTTVHSAPAVRGAAFAPSDPQRVYLSSLATLLRSDDGGQSFVPTAWTTSTPLEVVVSPSDPDRVYAATTGGVIVSTDGGQSATLIPGLHVLDEVRTLALLGDGRLYAATADGLYLSVDDGPLQEVTSSFEHSSVNRIRQDAAGHVWLARGGWGGGLQRSVDGGPFLPQAFLEAHARDVRILPSNGRRLVIDSDGAVAAPPGEMLVLLKTGDWRSAWTDPLDGGFYHLGSRDMGHPGPWIGRGDPDSSFFSSQSLEPNAQGDILDLAFSPEVPGLGLAAVAGGDPGQAGIYRTTDDGLTWNPVPGTQDWQGSSLAFDPHTPGRVLFVDTLHRHAESLDAGASWSTLAFPWLGDLEQLFLAADPLVPGRWYRGEAPLFGMRRSDDDGATWQLVTPALPSSARLVFHPFARGVAWLSRGPEVLLTGDGFDSWELLDVSGTVLGDGQTTFTGLAVEASTGALLLGTAETGTWEWPEALPYVALGGGTAGSGELVPRHIALGLPTLGGPWGLGLVDGLGGATAALLVGTTQGALPLAGGQLLAGPPFALIEAVTLDGPPGQPGAGSFEWTTELPPIPALVGSAVISQVVVLDDGGPAGWQKVLSQGLRTVFR